MSGELIVALVAVVLSGVVSLVNLGFYVWNSHLQREEEYRLKSHGKSLEVHQRAFELIYKLNSDYYEAKKTGGTAQIKSARCAKNWWYANALYLNYESQQAFVHLTNLCLNYERDKSKGEHLLAVMDWALEAIPRGIQQKHIARETADKVLSPKELVAAIEAARQTRKGEEVG